MYACPGIGACLPGTVIGIPNEGAVEVRFSDGERYAANTAITKLYMYYNFVTNNMQAESN